MNRSMHHLPIAMLAAALMLGACSKDDDTPEEPSTPGNSTPTNTNNNQTPSFPGADGIMWGINTQSTQTVAGIPFTMESGMGVAMFPSEADGSVYVDAGTVKLNDVALSKQSNNSYISIPDVNNPTGFDFSSGTTHWTVTGANGIPAIDQSPNFGFPTVGEITSSSTVTKSSGYTLTVADISPSDSVVFMVGSAIKYKPSGTTSCTFSAAELSGLTAGPSIIQVSPYSYEAANISGKDFIFGKQTARSASATIQ